MIFARRYDVRCEEDGLAAGAGAVTGVRDGEWPGWWRVRGNGGVGSGPRRCAVALEAAGQAAPPATARLPRYPGRLWRGTSAIVRRIPRAACLLCTSLAGPVGLARRRRALEAVEKVVTGRHGIGVQCPPSTDVRHSSAR